MSSALDYLVAARRCEVKELENLQRTCELVLTVNELVHHLQQERGASNMFLGAAGKQFGPLRAERIASCDAGQAALRQWLERADSQEGLSGGARLYTRIAGALHALDGLPEIRGAIDHQGYTAAEVTQHFSTVIDALLALVFEAADVAVDPALSRLLVALFHLMQGKEFAGQERATGAAAFAAGRITPAQEKSIEYLIEMQEAAFSHFEAFGEHLRAEWAKVQAALPLASLEHLRRKLLKAPDGLLDPALAVTWFDCCSRRMDELHRLETDIARQLQELALRNVSALRTELADHKALLETLGNPVALAPLAVFRSRVGSMPETTPAGGLANAGPHLMEAVVTMLGEQTQRLQSVTEELAAVRAALEERKLVERAKGLLMAHQGLNEEGAYRLLRKNAMNQNRRLSDVARAVICLAEMLPGSERSPRR